MPKMDDVAHTDNGSQIDLEGYRACRNQWCEHIMLKEVAQRTGDLCAECLSSHLGEQMDAVEIISRGDRTRVQLSRSGRRRENKGDRHTKRLTEKARLHALKRLRAVFPDLYDVFYAEERARVGLEPWTIESVVGDQSDLSAQQTMEFAAVYHHLDQHGVDVNGLEDTTAD